MKDDVRKRVNQTLGWLYAMDGAFTDRNEWRIRVYYLILYVAGLVSEAEIQDKVLEDIAL